MKTTKILHQIMACCLVLAVVLSMGLTGFAINPDQTGSITVNSVNENTTVSAYQIITIDVDQASGQPKSPMYYWVDEVADWLKTQDTYKAYINEADNSVTEVFKEGTAEQFKSFWHDLAAAIKAGTVDLTSTDQKAEAGQDSVTLTGMPMGQYLLTANGGVKIYQPTTAKLIPTWNETEWVLNNESVTMKGEAPTIDKDVAGSDSSVAIGDIVTYQVRADIPSYPEDATAKRFVVSDKISSGLTYNRDVKVSYDKAGEEQVSEDAYKVTAPSGDRTFEIEFNVDELNTAKKEIYVTYTATVNENAFEVDDLGNDAFLGYNNDPYDQDSYKPDGSTTEEDVYTYGIDVTKTNKDGSSALNGAEFKLYSDPECKQEVSLISTGVAGVYRHTKSGEFAADVLAVDGNGNLKLQGLDLGTYYLKETKAPDGYNLPKNAVTTIVISDNDPDGVLDDSSAKGNNVLEESVEAEKNVLSFKIWNTNDSGFELPTTGGMGTVLFTVVGLALMGGAIVLIVLTSKKKKAHN
ncbi:SpaH/EbpB family LPXTG-anchored major pilin [[Clostridium] leptum]|nr:SpaH/EbpB family LPXTG-anchored major pilin [[Clostridium] leptum]